MQGRPGAGRLLLSTALWLAAATTAVQWIIVGACAGDPGPPPRPPWADRQRVGAADLGAGLGRLGLPNNPEPPPPGLPQSSAPVPESVTGTVGSHLSAPPGGQGPSVMTFPVDRLGRILTKLIRPFI